MTQFVVVTDHAAVTPLGVPAGIALAPVDPTSLVRQAAESLLGLHPSDTIWQVVDASTRSADILFDRLHDALLAGEETEGHPILGWLRRVMAAGEDVACWYASDWLDLPRTDDADSLIREVLRQASMSPPEIYVLARRTPIPG